MADRSWKQLMQAGMEIIFPPACAFCRSLCRPDEQFPGICRSCLARLPLRSGRQNEMKWTDISNHRIPADSRVYCAAYYRGCIREALLCLKFADSPDLSDSLAALLLQMIRRNGLRFSAVVAVPLHRARLQERGYNQAGLLAGALSRELELPDWSGGLVRSRATERQSSAGDRMMRTMNMAGAFETTRDFPLPDKANADKDGQMVKKRLPLLLVDDVLTTGATLTAAAEPLWKKGWEVAGMVVASERADHPYPGYLPVPSTKS